AVLESQARRQEESFGAHHERLQAIAGTAQQKLTEAGERTPRELQARFADQVESAQAQIQQLVEAAIARLDEGATETTNRNTAELQAQIEQRLTGEIEHRIAELQEAASAIAGETEQRANHLHEGLRGELDEHGRRFEAIMGRADQTAVYLEGFASRL